MLLSVGVSGPNCWHAAIRRLLSIAKEIRIVNQHECEGGAAEFLGGRLSGYCLAYTESSLQVPPQEVSSYLFQLVRVQESGLTVTVPRDIVRVFVRAFRLHI